MYGNNMLILKNIYLIIIKNLSLVSIDLIKFLYKEFSSNLFKKIFFLKQANKKKGQILFDNFEVIDHFAYRYVVLKNIANIFNLKLKYFNLGYNLIYFLIYSSLGASNISFFLFKIRNKFLIKKVYLEQIIKIRSKKDLFNYKFKGLNIGWDIYESYLRKSYKSTIDINDKKFQKLFHEGHQIYLFWENYLKKNNVKFIMTSHRMYIETNILNRLALKKKIPIITLAGDGHGMMKFSTTKLSVHKYYKKLFNTLKFKEKSRAIKFAKSRLLLRLSGRVGVDMSYSTKSAFSGKVKFSKYKFSKNKTNVLICPHDFFDNPHPYGKNMFTDFYEWLIFLSNISHKTDYNWYIKLHPDYHPATMETILEINKKFKNIKLINPKTKFNQISHGIDFALTTHGSVGHELPLLGITVINCDYNNPHCAYKFNITPKNINDYRNKISNLDDKAKIKINKNEIYQFYYMNYYFMKTNLLNSLNKKKYKYPWVSFLRFTQEMYLSSKLKNDNNKIENFVLSKNSKYFDNKKLEEKFSRICNL
mgnify:FL=1|tara:strand:+ start:349 stop:1947 length:1599 start_codon:yes stop_codon:yes gene_type:complete